MTREEAIKEMIRAYDVLDFSCHMDNRRKEAFNMAKVALKQEPSEDAISRQAVLEFIGKQIDHSLWAFEKLVNGIKDLPPVNPQEPKYCDRNICVSNEYNGIGCDECEVTKRQEPSGDLISRQAVLDMVEDMTDQFGANHRVVTEGMISMLPPVNPQEPKTGHWIDHQEGRWIYAKCSECGTVHDTQTRYCPNCGAKMEVSDGTEI